ncbi:MAG: dephospho-CoA kinase [Chloroflexi bacterium]|nr:dephospho-CoA kinase [Chloroflexota bacterium]
MSEEQSVTHYDGKYIIGLTGNIATGKSAVMQLAREEGALTIDADKIVHELMDTNTELQEVIAAQFSSRVRKDNGRIDRKILGQIVFSDSDAMLLLESIIHPAVQIEVDQRILTSEATTIMVEAIKLLDGNLADSCHQVWVTRCDRRKQLERLRVCRGMAMVEAADRIKSQGSQEEKVAFADVVIDTDGLMADTMSQFGMVWSRLPDPRTVDAKLRLDRTPKPIIKAKSAATDEATTEMTSTETAVLTPDLPPLEIDERPEDLQVRRARPSDIPSILLLIQKATDGAVKMKRAELLMALSERGYFIGQIGPDISAVVGWNIDSQVGCVDEIYIYPPEMLIVTGSAILEEIEKSANAHVCQILVLFLPNDAPDDLRRLAATYGYSVLPKEELANNWVIAIEESQPDDTFYLLKILRDTRKG